LERISCPLGGNDPHEIAISIAAQLLERKQAQRPASRTRVQWGHPLGQGVNSGVFLRGEDSENPHPPMKGSSSFGRTSNRAFSGFDLDREVRSVTHLDLTVSCFQENSPSRAWQDQKAVLDFRRSIHSV
jgi:hypothetical protein